MSQLFDALMRDSEAVERMKKVIGEIQQEAKVRGPELSAVIDRMGTDVSDDVRLVLLAGFAAGRATGFNECSAAIFGQGVFPSLNTQVEKPKWWDELFGAEAPPAD